MPHKIIYIDNFLSKHGNSPTIAEALVKQLRLEGYEIICTSSIKNPALRLADMLKTIWQHRKKAVVLIATYSTSAFYFARACAWLCRQLNVKYIPCLHGGNLPERITNSLAAAKKLFGKAYINVAVSGYLQNSMQQHGWPSTCIPNPVNIDFYQYKEKLACRPRLFWVRSFHQLYNPKLALHLLTKLLVEYKDAELMMIGPDKDGSYASCMQLAKQLDVDSHVTFKGFTSKQEWTALSAGYDIFINTTNFDNLPVSIIEAMALGMVVVSTNVGGLPYLIENNVNGILLPPDDITAFVEAIKKIVETPIFANRLSKQARLSAEGYDWGTVRILWNKLLQEIPE